MFSLKPLATALLSTGLLVLPVGAVPLKTAPSPQTQLAQTPSTPAPARPAPRSTTPQAAIERLFRTPDLQSTWFDPSFLQRVPVAQFQRFITGFKSWLGNYQSVRADGNNFLVVFERGSIPAAVRLNPRGQIVGLGFECPRSTSVPLNQAPPELRQILSSCSELR
ncbi:hypothetical protein [Leptolyngbya sp. FACHB-261]|uniref:hypothetical protein n=1 Tax=Leptolyngbya sp. FACHB-261 TaxID=2692806 RepID=UPI001687C1BC|nr:hypothetical protein [Leptolyngbya sp. FACHB-261]MBD2099452.1 hypothetical protein [Leptolyngbya sp. FACHB-261]